MKSALFTSLVKMLLQAKENWVWKIIDYIPHIFHYDFFIDLLYFGNIMIQQQPYKWYSCKA